jgi:hypothetical protein
MPTDEAEHVLRTLGVDPDTALQNEPSPFAFVSGPDPLTPEERAALAHRAQEKLNTLAAHDRERRDQRRRQGRWP